MSKKKINFKLQKFEKHHCFSERLQCSLRQPCCVGAYQKSEAGQPVPWVPEAFHARFPVSVKQGGQVFGLQPSAFSLRPNTCRPAADETKLPVTREKKTSGTQSSQPDWSFRKWKRLFVTVLLSLPRLILNNW